MKPENANNISDYLKSFLKKNIAYSLSFLFERSVIFLLLPFYTKLFSTNEYGIYSIFIATVSIGVFIYSLGIENSLVKFKAENYSHNKFDSTILTGMWLPALGFTLLLTVFSNQFSLLIFGNEKYSLVMTLTGLSMLFETIIRYFMFSVIGEQKSKVFFVVSVIRGLLTIILNFILVGYYKLGLEGAVWSYLITIFIVSLVLIGLKKIKLSFAFDKELYKKLFKYSAPVMLTSAFLMMLNFADTYILKYFFDADQVGKYSASYKLGIGINIAIVAFSTTIIPFSLNLLKTNSEKKEILGLIFKGFVNFLLFLFVTLSLFYKEILSFNINGLYIIDPKFHDAIDIIPVIALSYVFLGIYTNCTVSFHYKGNTNKLALLTFIAMIINIILNIILVPLYSYWGAAVVTLISFFALSVITVIPARKILNFDYGLINLSVMIFVSTVIYLCAFLFFNENLFVKALFYFGYIIVLLFNFKKIKSKYIG